MSPRYDPFDDYQLTVDDANRFKVFKECTECGTRIYPSEICEPAHMTMYYPWYDRWQQDPCCSVHCQCILEADYDEEGEEIIPREKREWLEESKKPVPLLIDWDDLHTQLINAREEAKAASMED